VGLLGGQGLQAFVFGVVGVGVDEVEVAAARERAGREKPVSGELLSARIQPEVSMGDVPVLVSSDFQMESEAPEISVMRRVEAAGGWMMRRESREAPQTMSGGWGP
jgi:hypothetical protein